MGSTLAEDGELDAEVIHRVQGGRKNRKRVSAVLRERKINAKGKGKVYRTVISPERVHGAETLVLIEKAQENKSRCRRSANATMELRSYKARQVKK